MEPVHAHDVAHLDEDEPGRSSEGILQHVLVEELRKCFYSHSQNETVTVGQ